MQSINHVIISGPRNVLIAFCIAMGVLPAGAQQSFSSRIEDADKKLAFEREYENHYVYDAQGLQTSTHRVVSTIKLASAVQSIGQFRLTSNSFFSDLEIVEAATVKANGERRDVDRSKILKMTGSQAGSALFRADVDTYVVAFPDLAVGDKTLLVYKRKQKRALVPGVVSGQWLAPPSRYIKSIALTLDVPDSLNLRFAERDLVRESEPIPGGRRYRWRTSRGKDAPREPLSVSYADHAPAVFVSNLPDWNAFGLLYNKMIAGTSEPDESIRAKAEEITKGLNDKEAIARALFNWTARNIRYFRVMLGHGGWVPHQCKAILKAAYGDCKDHATLLKAFLAAKGIDSELVIINLARVYEPYPVPVISFDHMILYVPQFKRYLDATASTSSFDGLPLGLQGKPALHITANGAHMGRTPVMPAKAARVEFSAEVKIASNGAASGSSNIRAEGVAEQLLRNDARRIETLGPVEAVRYYLARSSKRGSGRMTAPEPLALVTPFAIRTTFEQEAPSDRSRGIALPVGPRVYSPPVNAFSSGIRDRWQNAFVCTPITYVERLKVTWDSQLKLRKPPRDIRVVSDFARYRASYKVSGNAMQVERIMVIHPPSVPCRPGELNLASRVFAAARFDARQTLDFAGDQSFDDAFDDPKQQTSR